MKIGYSTWIQAGVAFFIVVVMAVAGWLITDSIANSNRNNYFEVRKIQVATAAATVDYRDVKQLKGDSSDIATPVFQKLRILMVRVKNSDIHIRFAYLMRPKGDKLIFLVDSEDPASPDYSPPGQVYDETKPGDLYAFKGKKRPDLRIEGPLTDRWGTWISATAYILDEKGHAIAQLGTDVEVEKALASSNEIRHLGTIYDVLISALLALLALQYIIWRHNRERREALRTEMEESVVRLNAELLEADRMKSDFIELASHELRNPATTVSVAVQTIEKLFAGRMSDEEKELIEVARNGSVRLADLVDNLLDMTRIESGDVSLQPIPVDLRALLTVQVKVLEPVAREKGLDLSLKLPRGDLQAFLDPQALQRVIENLVSNAIKFTEAGSVSVELEASDDTLGFSVRDTGRGIPDEFKEELFQRFSRLHTLGQRGERGAGMGLSVCKGLVEAMGGRISVESEVGKGSTFRFEILRYMKVTPPGDSTEDRDAQ